MTAVLIIAGREVNAGFRNRWVMAATLILGALALSLVLLGSTPTGTVGASSLDVVVVSLASLTIFLIPLIALLLSFDAIVGEAERGTLLLLLAYPVSRWQIVLGKFVGQTTLLALATVFGYGLAGMTLWLSDGAEAGSWVSFGLLVGTSILLGAVFVALGNLASIVVRERATAAGIAVGIWLILVLIYDSALLGLLVAGQGQGITGGLLNWLLLFNPTDAYRLINLTGDPAVIEMSGMAGLEDFMPAASALYASLLAWIVAPLLLAIAVFARRQP